MGQPNDTLQAAMRGARGLGDSRVERTMQGAKSTGGRTAGAAAEPWKGATCASVLRRKLAATAGAFQEDWAKLQRVASELGDAGAGSSAGASAAAGQVRCGLREGRREG
jgi:hypothetical protein